MTCGTRRCSSPRFNHALMRDPDGRARRQPGPRPTADAARLMVRDVRHRPRTRLAGWSRAERRSMRRRRLPSGRLASIVAFDLGREPVHMGLCCRSSTEDAATGAVDLAPDHLALRTTRYSRPRPSPPVTSGTGPRSRCSAQVGRSYRWDRSTSYPSSSKDRGRAGTHSGRTARGASPACPAQFPPPTTSTSSPAMALPSKRDRRRTLQVPMNMSTGVRPSQQDARTCHEGQHYEGIVLDVHSESQMAIARPPAGDPRPPPVSRSACRTPRLAGRR